VGVLPSWYRAVILRLRTEAHETPGGGTRKSKGFALAVLILLVFLWAVGLDAIAYPWAFAWMRPLTTAPTLVGDWYGELTTPTGRRQWIALNLRLDTPAQLGRCTGCPRIEAAARVCDSHGLWRYEGKGHPGNWRGTQFDLALTTTGAPSQEPGIIRLHAEHDADSLRAIAELESIRSTDSLHATAAITTDRQARVVRPLADPDTLFPVGLLLRRSTERDFGLACRRLSSQRQPAVQRRSS
jgi:hypothetical protein